jgi:hypothetical protein
MSTAADDGKNMGFRVWLQFGYQPREAVRGVRIHEIRIEIVPAYQKAELIPESRLAITRTVGGVSSVPRRRAGGGLEWT